MNKSIKKIVNFINFSIKVDANSTSTLASYQPKAPAKLETFKIKNDK